MKAELKLLEDIGGGVLRSTLTVTDGETVYYAEELASAMAVRDSNYDFERFHRDRLWHSFQATLRWNLEIDPREESSKALKVPMKIVWDAGSPDIINGQPEENP